MSLPLIQTSSSPRRVVLLRHAPDPDGPLPHFDLLVEPTDAADSETRDVPTWRCPGRPDRLAIGEETAVLPIEPHRRWWLSRPPGEAVTLRPPLGIATVVNRGRLRAEATGQRAGDLDLEIVWDGDIPPMRFRIESSAPTRAWIGRRRSTLTDTTGCCGESRSCC